jgi:hypothetical protein
MKKYTKAIIFVFICVLAGFSDLNAQDIFDYNHSHKYAHYLLKAGEYSLAAEEFERLLYFSPGHDSFQTKLVYAYRKSKDFEKARKKIHHFYPQQNFVLKSTAIEFLIIEFHSEHFHQEQNINNFHVLNPDEKAFFKLSAYLLNNKFDSASILISEYQQTNISLPKSYIQIIDDYENIRFKNAFVAGSLSLLVPGLGQVYTGHWKDGIFALLFTASSAYQSYRGFDKNGIKSPYGWIYGTLATGFYIGNIYGAVKSANKHNKLKKQEIQDRIEKVFTSYYP